MERKCLAARKFLIRTTAIQRRTRGISLLEQLSFLGRVEQARTAHRISSRPRRMQPSHFATAGLTRD